MRRPPPCAQAHSLQQRLMSAEAELAASEDIGEARRREVETLRRALDLRAWELSTEEGCDVQARLLYALAKVRGRGASGPGGWWEAAQGR
jgi:hypothetical protein